MRDRLTAFVFALALALFSASAAKARPAPEALAEALAAAIYPQGAPAEIQARILADVRNEFRETDAAILRGEPDYLAEAYSAAILARQARHPATRGAMADLARQIWAHAVFDAASNPTLALWSEEDPMLRVSGLGRGLTRADAEAAQKLRGLLAEIRPDLVAPGDGEKLLLEGWAASEGLPLNQHFLVRLSAWTQSAVELWDRLDDKVKLEAASVLHDDAVPSPETVSALLGVPDLLGWLSGVQLFFTPLEASQPQHAELFAMLQSGAWAGGAASAAPGLAGGGDPAARLLADQMRWGALRTDMETQMMMMRQNQYLFGGGDPGIGAFGAWTGNPMLQ